MFSFGSIFQGINSLLGRFKRQYRCYPMSLLPGSEREDVERGGKIIMPSSALNELSQLNTVFPMLFSLTNEGSGRISHCGVLEFVADEGRVYMPAWMMQNLMLRQGDLVSVQNVQLPVAKFARFQPQSSAFLDISNPKAVLENTLRHFACLSTGDIFAITYNGKTYEVCVLETQPGTAVNIIECDMSVDFAAPLGYQEPMSVEDETEEEGSSEPLQPQKFVPFTGKANILDEKKRKKLLTASSDSSSGESSAVPRVAQTRGIPDYDYQVNTLQFIRSKPPVQSQIPDSTEDFKPFFGADLVYKKK